MSMGIVHLYGQSAQHMDAFIMGDEEGLIALRDAINEAIFPGKGKAEVEVYCNDGEGYTIYVKVVSDIFHADINKLPVPYTAYYAAEEKYFGEFARNGG